MTPCRNSPAQRRALKDVTLCAVSSSNLEATIRAMEASLQEVEVARALLFTHENLAARDITVSPEIEIVPIKRIDSSIAYSEFILSYLPDHIQTSYGLIVQWDGHVIDAERWEEVFLDYDYIGASWPQFNDGHDVGNGGFSLRSRRLMEACRDVDFVAHHPEDVAIGRTNRAMLETKGMVFAPAEVANRFAAERAGDPDASFGYHGVFLMPDVLGSEEFWNTFRTLDDRATFRHDFGAILAAAFRGKDAVLRSLIFIGICLKDFLKRRP